MEKDNYYCVCFSENILDIQSYKKTLKDNLYLIKAQTRNKAIIKLISNYEGKLDKDSILFRLKSKFGNLSKLTLNLDKIPQASLLYDFSGGRRTIKLLGTGGLAKKIEEEFGSLVNEKDCLDIAKEYLNEKVNNLRNPRTGYNGCTNIGNHSEEGY